MPRSANISRKPRPPRTEAALEALWRKDPAFIGPVGPPMALWLRDRARQAAWSAACNLTQATDQA